MRDHAARCVVSTATHPHPADEAAVAVVDRAVEHRRSCPAGHEHDHDLERPESRDRIARAPGSGRGASPGCTRYQCPRSIASVTQPRNAAPTTRRAQAERVRRRRRTPPRRRARATSPATGAARSSAAGRSRRARVTPALRRTADTRERHRRAPSTAHRRAGDVTDAPSRSPASLADDARPTTPPIARPPRRRCAAASRSRRRPRAGACVTQQKSRPPAAHCSEHGREVELHGTGRAVSDDREVARRVVQALGPGVGGDHDVLEPEAEPAREVDAGLDAERVARARAASSLPATTYGSSWASVPMP